MTHLKRSCCSPTTTNRGFWLTLAILFGILAGLSGDPLLLTIARFISDLFIRFLKLLSLPIVFLSIVSTASGMESLETVKQMGKKVITYTLLTTILAATVAMVLFSIIEPVSSPPPLLEREGNRATFQYGDYLIKMVPSNLIEPFLENQVIGVLVLALLLSFSILAIPEKNRRELHTFFYGLYTAVMHLCNWLIRWIPFAVFGFITLFVVDLKKGMSLDTLGLYLLTILASNLIQALIVLPLFLLFRGVNPINLFKMMSPALTTAFFTKSSSSALPLALKCAQEGGIDPKVANFSLPLCTTINMNACAAFIFTTVLFVGMSHGMTFSFGDRIMWIGLATIAAVGNAGVPMGCYFLSSALLAAMDVPLHLMGVILPFYGLIDMLESSINVWSDACVTAAVDEDMKELSVQNTA